MTTTKIIFRWTFIVLLTCLTQHAFAEQPVSDTVTTETITSSVYALPGLKLRLAPALNSEVITIIDFGEELKILKQLDDDLYVPPSIGWTRGSWALVDYDGMTGYIFDGFVSEIPFPTPRLTNATFTLTGVLDEYVKQHIGALRAPDTVNYHTRQDRHYHIKVKHYLENGIRFDNHRYIDKEKAILSIPNIRITDAYHLVRALIIGYEKGQDILDSVLFKKDENGKIYEISDRYRRQLIIRSNDGANVSIVVQDFTELGC